VFSRKGKTSNMLEYKVGNGGKALSQYFQPSREGDFNCDSIMKNNMRILLFCSTNVCL